MNRLGIVVVGGLALVVLIGARTERGSSSVPLSAAVALALAESPVADAAMEGDAETVQALLRGGADVNAAQGDGMTALHWAALNDDGALAEMLVYAGANPSAVTRLGDYTPLHVASMEGNTAVLATLLELGSDPGARTSSGGATALHFAASAANSAAIEILLEHGAVVDVRETAWGQTPLMFAASRNHVEVLSLLLEHGADPALSTSKIDIPLLDDERRADRQQRERRMEALRLLSAEVGGVAPPRPRADSRESAEPTEPTEPLSYSDLVGAHAGLTALLHAVREGHTEATLLLIDQGADVNQVSAGDLTSPMLMAMINGHFDLALTLMERGADINLANHAGLTPLYAAINAHWAPKARYPQQHAYMVQEVTYLDVMEVLLDAGADPNARLTKHLWFMGYNFDLLRVDTKGATPFWRAAYATDVEAMALLIANGAEPNVPTERVPERRFRRGSGPDQSGLAPVPIGGPAVWPIHAASGVGYGEGYAANAHRHVPDGWMPAVRYLVEDMGVNINARDHKGYNALHHAAARGDTELIQYLFDHGADIRAVSRAGQTTADMANGPVQRIQPFPEAVQLLESLGSRNNHNCVSC